MDETLESGKSLAAQARARLSDAVDPMVDKAREAAAQQKAAGAEQVSGVAAAVHRAAMTSDRSCRRRRSTFMVRPTSLKKRRPRSRKAALKT